MGPAQMPLSEAGAKEIQMPRNCSLRTQFPGNAVAMGPQACQLDLSQREEEVQHLPSHPETLYYRDSDVVSISVPEASTQHETNIKVGSGDRAESWVLRNGPAMYEHQDLSGSVCVFAFRLQDAHGW